MKGFIRCSLIVLYLGMVTVLIIFMMDIYGTFDSGLYNEIDDFVKNLTAKKEHIMLVIPQNVTTDTFPKIPPGQLYCIHNITGRYKVHDFEIEYPIILPQFDKMCTKRFEPYKITAPIPLKYDLYFNKKGYCYIKIGEFAKEGYYYKNNCWFESKNFKKYLNADSLYIYLIQQWGRESLWYSPKGSQMEAVPYTLYETFQSLKDKYF